MGHQPSHQVCGAGWLYGDSKSLCKEGCGLSRQSHPSRVTTQAAGSCMHSHGARKPKHCSPAPNRFLPAGSLVAMLKKAVPGNVRASITSTNSSYFQVKHPTGSAQTHVPRARDTGLCHPMPPGFPLLGEPQVPSCPREMPQLNPSPSPHLERRVPQHTPPDTSC